MIRAQHLIRGPHLSIWRLDHQPDADHRDPEEEMCSNYAVNFVEAGSFGLAVRDTHGRVSAGYVFLSQPGAVHRYTHHERVPSDVCVSVKYSGALAEQISQSDQSVSERLPLVIEPTNRLAFLKLQLNRLTNDDCALQLENWACELISRSGRQKFPGGFQCICRPFHGLLTQLCVEPSLKCWAIFNRRLRRIEEILHTYAHGYHTSRRYFFNCQS